MNKITFVIFNRRIREILKERARIKKFIMSAEKEIILRENTLIKLLIIFL